MALLFRVSMGVLASLLLSGMAAAQTGGKPYGYPESLQVEIDAGRALTFPKEAARYEPGAYLNQAFFRPSEAPAGPAPAIILSHNCGGVGPHLHAWVAEALKLGYYVLIPDSLRGATGNCQLPLKVGFGQRLRDTFDAAKHLASLPTIDPKRIHVVGFSQGAFVAMWLSSRGVFEALAQPGTPRIARAAALYGGYCVVSPNPRRPNGALVLHDDVDRPLLSLFAADDKETPPGTCLELLPKLKEKGAPVEWHAYPDITHAWDQMEYSGRTKRLPSGAFVTNFYNAAATEDSIRRVFEFLSRQP